MDRMITECNTCPRHCKSRANGVCRAFSDRFRIARYSLHMWEEPPISFKNGSGTIFFSGCNLRCVYCQNKEVSHKNKGIEYTSEEVAKIILTLEEMGADNINLVTPTHYTDKLIPILKRLKPSLNIPIVWNSSAYESAETLKRLRGLVDIYLPDFKYADSDLAANYSFAKDYPSIAGKAIIEMYSQVGRYRIDNNGKMLSGLIIRHLVLPGCRQNSIDVLQKIAETVPPDDILISLMSQYTPDFVSESEHQNLHRRVTSFEYDKVCKKALELGFEGYFQERSSAQSTYTPDFDGEVL